MAKYRYIGKSSINIQNGEVLDQEPTTWSVKKNEERIEVQVLYVKDYKGYDTPIRLSEFELCESQKADTGEGQLTIPDVSGSSFDEPENCNKDYYEDVCDGCEFRNYELVGHPGGGCDNRVSVEKAWCELGYWEDDF